jgi:multidrug efflux pump
MEQGMSKWKAAKEGSKEIYFAVISTSITLAVVFLPIIFLQGFVGRLFREFGIVVAGAVLISALVSLTLTPVLNVKMSSSKGHSHSWFYKKTEPFFRGMENGYRRMLQGFMKIRWVAWVILKACFWIIYLIGKDMPSELAPMEDRSQFRLSVTTPEGTSYDYMDDYMARLTQFVMDSVPEKQIAISITAPGFTGSGAVNTGFIRVVMKDPKERTRSQSDIVKMINKNLPRFNEGRAFSVEEQTISVNRRGGQPVQFVIQNVDFEKIKAVLPKILEQAQNSKVLQGVDADLKFNKPELRILIDRAKASALGITAQDISESLQLALSNRRLGFFTKEGKQYQVMAQVSRNERDDPADLKSIFIRNKNGQLISLDNIVTMVEESSPPVIYHYNRYKSATISGNLAPGKTVGDGIKEMQEISKKVLDETFSTALSGTSRDFAESGSNTMFAFILALALIFLILAAQFESFIDPFIIMFTVPLAIAGALISLAIFGQTLNIFSQIGMIMLIGLVTKNGILIVEFANQKQIAGDKKIKAVTDAAVSRFRPILMTSLAMALGALPLALSLGDASTSRVPLGIVIVGGVMFALILTLFVIPAIYSFLSSKKKKSELDNIEEETTAKNIID